MIGPEEPPSWSGKRKRDDQHHHQQGKKERPDFARLAGKYDYFARHAMRTKKKNKSHEMDKVFIDFTSWQATHDLCRALLEEIGVKKLVHTKRPPRPWLYATKKTIASGWKVC